MEKRLPPTATRTRAFAWCAAALVLYAYGVLSAKAIPMPIEGVALPLDFMVGIPLGFYLLVVRPRRLTLLTVIPVIWAGYALSAVALGAPNAGILPFCSRGLFPWSWPSPQRSARRLRRSFAAPRRLAPIP